MDTNCGGFLKGHSSQISRLMMTKAQDLFYSLGMTDNTLIEWKIDYVMDCEEESKAEEKISNKNKKKNVNTDINEQLMMYDECLYRELNYSYSLNNITDKFKGF